MEICSWMEQIPHCGCVIGGDFNTDLDLGCNISKLINSFLGDNKFTRCNSANSLPYTYVNEAQNYYSNIDYFVYNNAQVRNFSVIEPDINFSDHLPISITCTVSNVSYHFPDKKNVPVDHLRWDHADLLAYYNSTQVYLQPILEELLKIEQLSDDGIDTNYVDLLYERIVTILKQCADSCVPKQKKNFFKFWWSTQLNSINS